MEAAIKTFIDYRINSMMIYMDLLEKMIVDMDARMHYGNTVCPEFVDLTWDELVDDAMKANKILGELIQSIK